VAVAVPTLETTRLRLRPWRAEDIDGYAAMCGNPEVMRYLAGGAPLSREESWSHMAMFVGHWHLRGFGTWAVEDRATHAFIGRVGLHQPEGWPGLEVGWALDRATWGRGYATEAGRASLTHAWQVLGADHVISLIAPDNAPSIRVAERLGESLEGTFVLDGVEVLVYGIDRPA
jgi:RimJ/RimL family protein N-acetyltransferase